MRIITGVKYYKGSVGGWVRTLTGVIYDMGGWGAWLRTWWVMAACTERVVGRWGGGGGQEGGQAGPGPGGGVLWTRFTYNTL